MSLLLSFVIEMFPKCIDAVVTVSFLGESFDFVKHLGAVFGDLAVMIYSDEVELDRVFDDPVFVFEVLASLCLLC